MIVNFLNKNKFFLRDKGINFYIEMKKLLQKLNFSIITTIRRKQKTDNQNFTLSQLANHKIYYLFDVCLFIPGLPRF